MRVANDEFSVGYIENDVVKHQTGARQYLQDIFHASETDEVLPRR
jgi:hypothetical protein